MGTFLGHFQAGVFFSLFAIWWTTQMTRRFFICRKTGTPYYNSVTFPVPIRRVEKWPIEGAIKVVITGVGIVEELLASANAGRAGKIVFIDDIQHVAMYSLFLLAGIVDLLVHYRCLCTPPGADYAMHIVAVTVESLLFSFHLYGRDPLNVATHTMLVYVVMATVIAIIIEFYYQESILAGYTRAYFLMLQGTWFIHMGFILFPPFHGMHKWKKHDEHQIMLAAIYFSWHMIGVFVGMMILAGITVLVCKCCKTQEVVKLESLSFPNAVYTQDSDSEKDVLTTPSTENEVREKIATLSTETMNSGSEESEI